VLEPNVLDTEVYRNFFLILFKGVDTGTVTRFQISPNRSLNRNALRAHMKDRLLIGFNSREYDIPMIQCALKGYSASQLKDASDEIINAGLNVRDFADKHDLGRAPWNHIDLKPIAPLSASLKLYAGRLHCKKMQDLPYDPEIEVNAEQAALLVEYCENDLDNTNLLYTELKQQIALRESLSKEYGQDLRSRSDAQIAEHVIAAEVAKINGSRPQRPTGLEGTAYRYNVPSWVKYRSPRLQMMLERIRNASFVVGESGAINLPKELDGLEVRVSGGKYRLGIGGLHSSETCVSYAADEEYCLIDRDVSSFYPMLILTLSLYPVHLGEAFLTVYKRLVDRRLAAKKQLKRVQTRIAQLERDVRE
jgi:hypothetical protein